VASNEGGSNTEGAKERRTRRGPIVVPEMPRRSASIELGRRIGTAVVPTEVGPAIRPVARRLIPRIAEEILREVDAYARAATPRRRELIHLAVQQAVDLFVDVIEHVPTSPDAVRELYFSMGRGEAFADQSLDGFRAALEIATHRVAGALADPLRQSLDSAAAELSDADRASTGALLRSSALTYMALLAEDVARGYDQGLRDREQDPAWLRRQLFARLVAGSRPEEVADLCVRLGRRPPDALAVCGVDTATTDLPDDLADKLAPDVLWSHEDGRTTVLAAPDELESVCATLSEGPRTGPSWSPRLCLPPTYPPRCAGPSGRARSRGAAYSRHLTCCSAPTTTWPCSSTPTRRSRAGKPPRHWHRSPAVRPTTGARSVAPSTPGCAPARTPVASPNGSAPTSTPFATTSSGWPSCSATGWTTPSSPRSCSSRSASRTKRPLTTQLCVDPILMSAVTTYWAICVWASPRSGHVSTTDVECCSTQQRGKRRP